MSTFSFSFSGDDIEDTHISDPDPKPQSTSQAAETGSLRKPSTTTSSSAFPIPGQTLLTPQSHDLNSLLKALPSKIAYGTLIIKLDDGSEISLPRRELWDVRVQLMAEDNEEGLVDLGKDDVRTGVYEGGFKSWESSVDLVKVLHGRRESLEGSWKVLELGCGTALPSLVILQWFLQYPSSGNLDLGLADYNPTVLQLVTFPNILLTWAQATRPEGWEVEGELEIDESLIKSFIDSLTSQDVTLSFFSGAWSAEFVNIVSQEMKSTSAISTIIGAETIYSPAALKAFGETLLGLLESLLGREKSALVAAKKVYFGVGGSMEDFCNLIRESGRSVEQIREEEDGVRRAIVEVKGVGS